MAFLNNTGLSHLWGKITAKLDTKVDKEDGKGLVAVDSSLSSTSTNPVQNKVINGKIVDLNNRVGDETVTVQIGRAINDCITELSISGTTITYKKKSGSTDTLTTQDTNTTYSNMVGATSTVAGAAGLVPAPVAGANLKYLRGDGTWQDVSAITNDEIDIICNAAIYDQSEVQV